MRACRICLTKNDLSPIFGRLSAVRFTSKQLFDATGVQIHPKDGFPQFACSSCIDLIKNALHLRTLSTHANLNLKLILQKSSSKIKNSSIKNEDDDNDTFNNDHLIENDIFNNDYSLDNDESDIFNDIVVKIERKDDNSVHDNIFDNDMIETSIITANDFQNSIKMKRTLRKRKKIIKNISIDDLESSDSNCNDSNNDFNITIEDFESGSENDFDLKTNKSLHREFHYDDILNNRYDKRDRFYDNLGKIYDNSNRLETNDMLINDRSDDVKMKCKDNKNRSNNKFNNKLDINNKSTKLNIKSSVLNNKVYCNLDDSGIGNIIPERNKVIKQDKQQKSKPFACMNEKYSKLAGTVKGGYVKCKECKKYIRRSSFVTHASRHFEPEFACEHCGRRFRSKPHMVYHQQRLHGRQKRLACDKCPYRTVSRNDLTNHDRVAHTGEKPFVCDVCKASFPLKRNITQHMRSHFGIKNVQCEKCSKMFTCKSRLWSHQHRTHLDNYHYHCYLCSEKFRCHETVKRHLLNFHGIPLDQQLRVKYVRTKRISEVNSPEEIVIPSRNYVKNIDLISSKIPGTSDESGPVPSR